MKLLAVASNYPSEVHQFAGLFNERCVAALQQLCEIVQVLVPRPYVPPILSLLPVKRWQAYKALRNYEARKGNAVHRPACLQIPGVTSAFWLDRGAFLQCRRMVQGMHRQIGFDAIVSFDLLGAGGLAWRLARDLGIPASGWAFGDDIRQRPGTSLGAVVARALQYLDLVLYQSHELLECASRFFSVNAHSIQPTRHVVLAHGIPAPPAMATVERRRLMRSSLGTTEEEVLVLAIGRIVAEKGVYDLLHAVSLAASTNPRIRCVLVGSNPGFDDTAGLKKKLATYRDLQQHLCVLPACNPDQIWDYICAADILAFPSHGEGMPNALLEAMAMGIPAVAYSIPSVAEVEGGTGALLMVPCFDISAFSDALVHLSTSRKVRAVVGDMGRTQVMTRFMIQRNMTRAFELIYQMIENHRSIKYHYSRPLLSEK